MHKFLINDSLFNIQKLGFVFLILLFSFLPFYSFKGNKNLSRHQILLNINTATEEELIKLPYIGKKTARKILDLKNSLGGRFTSLAQLKNIKNFNKFKKYLKVE